MSKKKYNPNKGPRRPNSFGTPVECLHWIKKSVYLIARGRTPDLLKPYEILWSTIGTGCIVAPNRMITAAHVLHNMQSSIDLNHHKDGDKYYLIKNDDEGNWHYSFFTPKINKDLFIFQDVDLAIIYLEEEFYQSNEQVFALKDDYIRIDRKFRPIGTEVAVLGYPLCKLGFIEKDVNKPNVGNLLLRVDTGVINSRYRTSEKVCRYEFTIAFNPGNSGGPIFDWRTGQLLSIVHGYKAIPINISECVLTEKEKNNIGITRYTEDSYIDILHAVYSDGFATPSFMDILLAHKILI